jgi:hypothetical protein
VVIFQGSDFGGLFMPSLLDEGIPVFFFLGSLNLICPADHHASKNIEGARVGK